MKLLRDAMRLIVLLALALPACGGGGGEPGIDVLGSDFSDGGRVDDGRPDDGGLPDSGAPDEVCAPDCDGKSCGADGCGGTCGDCGPGELCQLGTCVPEGGCETIDDCLPRVCGADGECTDCTDDADCAEAGLVCNEDSGHCVDCVEDEDCPEGLICDAVYLCVECLTADDCGPWDECVDNSCVGPALCESSKDCADDEVCWKEEGICVECVEDADCEDGFRCTENVCEEILFCDSDKDCKDYDMVCDKDLGECVDCLGDADCADDHFCMDATCLLDLCDQTAEGPVCLDGDVVECVDNGSAVILIELCPEGTFCADAACVEWVCVPGEAGCDGDLAFLCDDEGSGYAWEEVCEVPDISCVMGECVEVVCEPGETVCLNPQALVTCDDEGLTFEVTECSQETYCDDDAGACLEWVCTPESIWCEGTTAMTCDLIGAEVSVLAHCADQDLSCVNGECVECEPDCEDAECGDDGCGGTCGECDEGFSCAWGGQCYADICTGECTGTTPAALLCGLELCLPGAVLDTEIYSPTNDNLTNAVTVMEHYGSAQNDLAAQAPPSYLVVGTGILVGSQSHDDDLPGGSSTPWNDPWSTLGGRDVARVGLDLQAPAGVTGFCLDTWFLSREFMADQPYNDRFYLLFAGAESTEGETMPINFMLCPDPGNYTSFTDDEGAAWCYVTVESGFDVCSQGTPDLSATGFSCGYGWMRTCWPLAAGEEFSLTVHVHDVLDAKYDSVVIADNFQWIYGNVQQGTWFLD